MTLFRFSGRVAFVVFWPAFYLAALTFGRRRVRVLIESPTGEWLLIRTSIGKQRWAFPGGGVARGESPVDACVREVAEEIGVHIQPSDLTAVRSLEGEDSLPFRITLYKTKVSTKDLPRLGALHSLEILDRRWFDQDELVRERRLSSSVRALMNQR